MVVLVALSHRYLSERGNVLALSPINPSPRSRWTYDTRESPPLSSKLAPATSSRKDVSPYFSHENRRGVSQRMKLLRKFIHFIIWKDVF